MAQVTLTIDGQQVSVESGTTVIEAAKILKNEIPHYCYHPGLKPDGNCRMCLVKIEKFPKPMIACMTQVAEGMVVDTKSEEVEQMRRNVMEFLLINHPLDCPTCDQAGECRLQDYYMKYDRIPTRFKETKVHKDKMVDLGAGVMLDEERCVVCRRCVRFCDEVAGEHELEVQARGDHSMVATFPGKKLSNPYAVNVVDICPVGALTSKDFRYKKRVWLLSRTESVCPGCSRGCNINIDHADVHHVYRLVPRHNPAVNKYWMCDAGRSDYKFINDNRRVRPGYQNQDQFTEASLDETLRHLRHEMSQYSANEIAFVASARESNEEIDAFAGLAKNLFFATEVYYSKNDPAEPYHDKILITPDKNPNLAHVKKLGLKPVAEIPAHVKTLVVQRDLSAADLKQVQAKGLKILLLFATNAGSMDQLARVILPIPTYAEQNGHFTNVEGLVQPFNKAFEPRGESLTIASYATHLENMVKGERRRA